MMHPELTGWLRAAGPSSRLNRESMEIARDHGVHLLIADRAAASRTIAGIDAAEMWLGELRGAAVLEAVRERELRRTLDALAAASVPALLLKGAALAYTVYSAPHLRPRADVDIFIRSSDRAPALDALASLGYEQDVETSGDLVTSQSHLYRIEGCLRHTIDMHWQIVDPLQYADRLTFNDLSPSAIAIPRLGAHAHAPAPAEHLLILCLHRAAHHQRSARLIWLYDIHLLAATLDADAWTQAAHRARSTGLGLVCRGALDLVNDAFGAIDPAVRAAFGTVDAEARITAANATRLTRLRDDLNALTGVRAQLRLMSQHLFPPSAYVRGRYPRVPSAALPLAYVWRALRGAPKWFRP